MLKKKDSKPEVEISIYDHLDELRIRLIKVIASIVVMTILLYSQFPRIILFLSQPIKSFNLEFVFFSMTEAFITRLKLAFVLAIVLVAPLILYQFIAYVGPGLKSHEKKILYRLMALILPSFFAGAVFCYFAIVPIVLEFLITYGTSYMTPVLSGDKYFTFITMLCVIVGISFTIPIILLQLGKLGILSSRIMKKARKYILAAVLLGEGIIVNDITSFLLIAAPFVIIYEINLWILIIIEKRREKRNGFFE